MYTGTFDFMLSIESIKEHLNNVLPFEMQDALITELFYCCSSITFNSSGENLFRRGDAPKGFYWLLKGKVDLLLPTGQKIIIGEGNFIGMDNFVSNQAHHFDIVTIEKHVQTLFIDRKCYNNLFMKKQDLSNFVLQKHLKQLLELKNSIGSSALA